MIKTALVNRLEVSATILKKCVRKEYAMIEKKKNPIAEQSRQWLIGSLLSLMSRKNYNDITVTEIAEQAQLSRRTFYRIFDSKEQVLQQHFLEICDDYIDCFNKGTHYSLDQIIETFFVFWEKHIDFLALLQQNHLFYYLLEEFNLALPSIHDIVYGDQKIYSNPLETKIALLASAGALWNILSEWLQFENRPSPKEISEMLLNAIAMNS